MGACISVEPKDHEGKEGLRDINTIVAETTSRKTKEKNVDQSRNTLGALFNSGLKYFRQRHWNKRQKQPSSSLTK